MPGGLSTVEIADDGHLIGCNIDRDIYTEGSVRGAWNLISGSLFQTSIGA